ncbi:hypothetical protein F0562_030577 [Nyssa sinensis]|uniref:Two-component response regulator n=1 Tax=Nyssa sinensis TaxID=561372 RepID=A0A5J5AYP5_9ASTE|nr:hypothetical protein F0562_030577 [Nyssa sinensis]
MTTKATEALEMLRKDKDNYDIVITDVKMLDMDGFELLEIIGLEMDIPVIMMSANDDTESVMKGVKHGARDYLVKPVRIEELRNIWQHVIRKNILDPNKLSIMKGEVDQNQMPSKRQRDKSKEKEDETNTQSNEEGFAQKKQRVAWTPELHRKFVDAVQYLEVDKAVPKKILELMNERELSRENVASHLQKYRNLLRKEKKKASMSQEGDRNVDSNKTHRHLSNATSLSSHCHGLNAVNHHYRSGEQSTSNAGMCSFGDRFQTYGSSLVNTRPFFIPLNSQDMMLQRNPLPPQMGDQPIPVLRNVPPAPILVTNPCPQLEYNGITLNSIRARRKMIDDYVEICSRVPNFGACQSGPSSLPFIGSAPYSCPPGAFNIVGASFQMPGDASTQMNLISQPDSLVGPVPSSSAGQHERRNNVSSNGRGGLDFLGQTTGFPIDMRGPTVDDSTGNGQINFVEHPPESSERENNGHHNNCNSPDDDLSIMVKQFGNNSAPKL